MEYLDLLLTLFKCHQIKKISQVTSNSLEIYKYVRNTYIPSKNYFWRENGDRDNARDRDMN